MSLIKRIFCSPAPMWMVVCFFVLSLVAASEAAIVTYTGSFNVATSGHITDANQSASACAGYNSSHQLNSANCLTAVTASGNIASSGGSSPNITFTGILPIANGGFPVYSSSGGSPGSTFHAAYFTVAYSGTCTNGSSCFVAIPSFTGSAAFTSLTTTACSVSAQQANTPPIFGALYATYVAAGPNLEVAFENASGSTISAATFYGMCWGP